MTKPAQIDSATSGTPAPHRSTAKPRSAASAAAGTTVRAIGSKCTPGICVAPTPAQAHCSVCHETWGGVRGFDAHRNDGRCVDPASLGYVQRDGVWRLPMPEDVAERLRASKETSGA